MTASRRASRKAPAFRKAATDGAHLWLLARHDFRQPVQSLGLLAEALAGARTDETRRQCASGITHIAAALGEMVEGLSLVAGLDTGQTRPARLRLSLPACIASAVADLGLPAEWVRERVAIRAPSGTVMGDPALTHLALRGVLVYALKFCEKGEIVVETALHEDGRGSLHLTFEGEHAGTALADMAFVELAPLNAAGRPLVGLGPALVARILSHTGGELALDMLPNGRARIAVALPSPSP